VRLTPWAVHDLPRIAWMVEYRAADLTEEERGLIRDAAGRLMAVVSAAEPSHPREGGTR
jgi:hypothetical protein